MQPITVTPKDVTNQLFFHQEIATTEHDDQPVEVLLNMHTGDWVVKANGKMYAIPLLDAVSQLIPQMFTQDAGAQVEPAPDAGHGADLYWQLVDDLGRELYGDRWDMEERRLIRELVKRPVTLQQLTQAELALIYQELYKT